MIFKLGIEHQGFKAYNFYVNDDPWLTVNVKLTFCALSRPLYLYRVSVYKTTGRLVSFKN